MLKNLKVGTRLALGFALMIVLLVAIAALSILRIQELNEAVNLLVLDRYQKVAQVNEAINQVNVIAQSLRDMILWGENIQEVNNESDRIVTAQTSITKIIEELTRNITDEESKKRLAHLNVTRQAYLTGQNAIMELANVGQAETYQQATDLLLGPYQTQQGDYVSAWGALREYQYELASEDAAKAKATAERAIRIVILISAASIVLALLFALLITRSIVNPLGICIAAAGKLAKGETQMDFDTSGKDELATLQREMKTMTDTIRSMVSDAVMLSQAAVEGRLKIRADASRHQGDFKNIVQGVNETLDAVIGPLKVAASYVDRISKGDIPEKITDEYKGDFNLIKNNLNTCVDAIKALVADTDILTQAAIEGKLATRADTARHQGDFRKIVEGVNRTLDLVVTPINDTIAVLKHMAEGDLTAMMSGDYKGDFDVLKKALKDSLESINELLGQVNIAVEQVAAGSVQVSQASQALSQGATEQASSLEEITSSITEVSSQTKQNTESAIQVNGLAKTARNDADRGNQQMKDLVAAMNDINVSAEEIRKIVKTIDDISFQINLLALNANVEAARAGKYGKGFAVVAEEVRNLAVRSASSVKDTTRMVDEAIRNIEKGNALVEVTAKQLSSIVEGASKVAALAEEVAIAGKEQSQGLEQITLGLNQIDQVTQSNTASAEESASAAEELSSQSQQVKGMLGRFKLKVLDKNHNNAEIIQMLKNELARLGGTQTVSALSIAPRAAEPAKPRKPAAAPRLNPAEVIALDDDNFGKFRG